MHEMQSNGNSRLPDDPDGPQRQMNHRMVDQQQQQQQLVQRLSPKGEPVIGPNDNGNWQQSLCASNPCIHEGPCTATYTLSDELLPR